MPDTHQGGAPVEESALRNFVVSCRAVPCTIMIQDRKKHPARSGLVA
jgi:hypothetical protein